MCGSVAPRREVVARIVAAKAGGASLRTIAAELTADAVPTAQGGAKWHASTVKAVLDGQDAARHANRIPAQICYDSTPKDADGILMFNANNCYPISQP